MNTNNIISIIFVGITIIFVILIITTTEINKPSNNKNIDSTAISEKIIYNIIQDVKLHSFIDDMYYVKTELWCNKGNILTLEYNEFDKINQNDIEDIKIKHLKSVNELIDKLKEKYGKENVIEKK